MKTLFLLLSVALACGCNRAVVVTITGPPELAGAVVAVNGKDVGALSRFNASDAPELKRLPTAREGVFAQFEVAPGTNHIEIRKTSMRTIVIDKRYEREGEDYIDIAENDIRRGTQ